MPSEGSPLRYTVNDGDACDIAIIGSGISGIRAAKECAKHKGLKIVACPGNEFIEFSIAAAKFVCKASEHAKFVAGTDAWMVKGVKYVIEPVEQVDPALKKITFAGGKTLTYRAIVVATGSRMPLIMPTLGDSLAARIAEVKKASDAIAKADTVVFNGGGLVGVEMAGDCRAAYPSKRIVLLSRDGKVLSKTHPPEMQDKVHDVLTRVHKVEIIAGSAPRDWLEPCFEKGSIPISGNDSITSVDFDFYMPCFAQGPRNEMLSKTDALNASGRMEVNECLQSTKYPSMFGVNTTSYELVGHPISMRVGAAAATCAKNAVRHLSEQPPLPHVDKEMVGPLPYPMNIKIGHGKGGYMIWDLDSAPLYIRCMMGTPCGLGYPCFPCVCCDCCCPVSGMLGNCCGPPEGEGPAKAMDCMLGLMAAFQGINGLGKLPPEMATMTRA